MRTQPNVVVLANDETLRDRAATEITGAGCRVRTEVAPDLGGPDLIVRDWRDERWLSDPRIPVITLDLHLVRCEDLLDLVRRALGLAPPSIPAVAGLYILMCGRLPRA